MTLKECSVLFCSLYYLLTTCCQQPSVLYILVQAESCLRTRRSKIYSHHLLFIFVYTPYILAFSISSILDHQFSKINGHSPFPSFPLVFLPSLRYARTHRLYTILSTRPQCHKIYGHINTINIWHLSRVYLTPLIRRPLCRYSESRVF